MAFSPLRYSRAEAWVDYALAPYGKLGSSYRISIAYRGSAVAADDEFYEE